MKSLLTKLMLFCWVITGLIACMQETNYSDHAREGKQDTDQVSDSSAVDSPQFVRYSSEAVSGETVYVPVYSHIYQQNLQRTFNLTATLSIRNTDLQSPISISKIFYYDSNGNIVQKFLEETRLVDPLSSISYVVEEEDLRGGVGANFLVLWEASKDVNKPVIEAVMISTSQQQGISFISKGRTIHSLSRTPE